jgi:hypothetical protein
MDHSKEQIELIQYWIDKIFYYVEYPDPIQEYAWKDGEGRMHFMDNMGLDHLKASARKIQNDVDNFLNGNMRVEVNFEILKEALIVPALIKKAELEEILKKKVLD